jgi:hypothetical protein
LIGPVLVLIVSLVLVVLLLPDPAKAGLVIRGQAYTPGGRIVVAVDTRHGQHRRQPARYHYPVSRMDHKIARKLARRTPYRKAVYLDLRRAGYSWREIGRILHIPRRIMRTAIRPVLHDHNNSRHWRDYYNRSTALRYRNDD